MPISGLLFNIQKFSIHDGPGIRTVLFFKGCPLSCLWCSNPESRDGNACREARSYTLDEIMKICLADRPFYEESAAKPGLAAASLNSPEYSGGGVTLSGGEALSQIQFALELLRALKAEKIHSAMETSGYAPSELFKEISEVVNLLLFDIKHFDNKRHIEGTGVPNNLILENLKNALARNINVLPRIPVIPSYNDSAEDASGFASLLESIKIKRVQILPFHQFGEKKYELLGLHYAMESVPQFHPEDLEEYRQIFLKRGIECFF